MSAEESLSLSPMADHCFMCSNLIQIDATDLESVKQSLSYQECHQFVVLVSRFVGFSDQSEFDDCMLEKVLMSKNHLCENCGTVTKSFCQVYQEWDRLQQELNRKLEAIARIIRNDTSTSRDQNVVGHRFKKNLLTKITKRRLKLFPEALEPPEAALTFVAPHTSANFATAWSTTADEDDGLISNTTANPGMRPVECTVCQENFSSLPLASLHESLHQNRPFQCALCSNLFEREPEAHQHARTNHSDEELIGAKYYCRFCCREDFSTPAGRDFHENQCHTTQQSVNRKLGEKRLPSSVNGLHRHQKKGRYKCEKCGQQFATEKYFQSHLSICIDISVTHATSERFPGTRSLMPGGAYHDDLDDVPCSEGDPAVSRNSPELSVTPEVEVKVEVGEYLEIEDNGADDEANLPNPTMSTQIEVQPDIDYLFLANMETENDGVEEEPRGLERLLAKPSTPSLSLLAELAHSSKRSRSSAPPSTGGMMQSYTCSICGEVFAYSLDYARHLNSHTLDSDLKHFQCKQCAARFSNEINLTSHMARDHEEAKSPREQLLFKCGFCDESFSNVLEAMKHEEQHMHERASAKKKSDRRKPITRRFTPRDKRRPEPHQAQESVPCKEEMVKSVDNESVNVSGEIEASSVSAEVVPKPFELPAPGADPRGGTGEDTLASTGPALPDDGISFSAEQSIVETQPRFYQGRNRVRRIELVSPLEPQKHINAFTCGVCGKAFNSSGSKSTHQARHFPGKFSCDFCGKTFIRKYEADRHMKSVHTAKS